MEPSRRNAVAHTLAPSAAIALVALAAVNACSRSSKPPVVNERPGTHGTGAELVRSWDRAIQGRTIATAESKFILIQNDSCPGARTVSSRFTQVHEALIQITEDNSSLQCTEGVVSRSFVLIWRKGLYDAPPDTIHMGPWITTKDELLEGTEDGGMLPPDHDYYSVETGKPLFSSQFPAVAFTANGSRRYLGVAAGTDTMAAVAYSSASAIKQVLRVANPHDSLTRMVIRFIVDSMSLDGPGRQCCNNIMLGTAGKDTVAVSGITLTFWLGSDGEGDGAMNFPSRRFTVRIVNDRMFLDTTVSR